MCRDIGEIGLSEAALVSGLPIACGRRSRTSPSAASCSRSRSGRLGRPRTAAKGSSALSGSRVTIYLAPRTMKLSRELGVETPGKRPVDFPQGHPPGPAEESAVIESIDSFRGFVGQRRQPGNRMAGSLGMAGHVGDEGEAKHDERPPCQLDFALERQRVGLEEIPHADVRRGVQSLPGPPEDVDSTRPAATVLDTTMHIGSRQAQHGELGPRSGYSSKLRDGLDPGSELTVLAHHLADDVVAQEVEVLFPGRDRSVGRLPGPEHDDVVAELFPMSLVLPEHVP